jgi:uncharacterized protein (UPF0332 family)
MDDAAKRTVIRVRLDKAHDDLAMAHVLLHAGGWRAAVNRAYYTVFHVASAALLWLDVERTKHSAVQASFNQVLVKPGLIETEYSQVYKMARDWCEEQDYSDTARALDEPMATQIVNDAERFVARLERYLREAGAIE